MGNVKLLVLELFLLVLELEMNASVSHDPGVVSQHSCQNKQQKRKPTKQKKKNPGPAGDGERFGTVTAQVQDLPGIPRVPKPGMWSSLTPIFI